MPFAAWMFCSLAGTRAGGMRALCLSRDGKQIVEKVKRAAPTTHKATLKNLACSNHIISPPQNPPPKDRDNLDRGITTLHQHPLLQSTSDGAGNPGTSVDNYF